MPFTTEERTYQWPPPGLTLKWFARRRGASDVWAALTLSVQVAAISTVLALVLGHALRRCGVGHEVLRPRGRSRCWSSCRSRCRASSPASRCARPSASLDIPFSFWTIILGHATFCIVVVYNNAVARFRRLHGSLVEASMDLGADGFQTFRYVILPNIGTALLAGGMLAFALSFDEVIVTTFTAGQQQTLPIWMLEELIRPRQRPVTNVVAMVVVLVTFLPILAAFYLTRDGEQELPARASARGERLMDTQMLIGSRFEAGTETEEQVLNPRNGRADRRRSPRRRRAQIDVAVSAADEGVRGLVAHDAGAALGLSAEDRGGDRGRCRRVRGARGAQLRQADQRRAQ